MRWLKRLSHRFWLWVGERVEYHRTLGAAGFEAIYYKGVPVERDTSTKTVFWPEDSHFEEKANEAAPMTFGDKVIGLRSITEKQIEEARSSRVLMDRVLEGNKWNGLKDIVDDSTDVAEYGGLEPAPRGTLDTMIRKGYDKYEG